LARIAVIVGGLFFINWVGGFVVPPVRDDIPEFFAFVYQSLLGFIFTLVGCAVLLLAGAGLMALWPEDSKEDKKKLKEATREKELLSDPNFDPLKIKKENIVEPERQELNVAGKTYKITI